MSSTISHSNATQKFQKTIGGSIKSLVSPGSRTYFVIEHKTDTEKHKMGESANFIGDYIELGRGDSYAINFGDDCKTVGRPHAAIVRKGDAWAISPVSKTNVTLLNGRNVSVESPLNNGDEIQLSARGPKLSFLVPANPKLSNMNFTVRIKAVVNEAIRPYRTTIAVITVLFLLIIGGGGYWAYDYKTTSDQRYNDLFALLERRNSANVTNPTPPPPPVVVSRPPSPPSIKPLYNDTYFIRSTSIQISYQGKDYTVPYQITGSGFLLNDGRFVTARHMVQPWLYISSTSDSIGLAVNMFFTKGADVTFSFTAYSPSGKQLKLDNKSFSIDNSSDERKTLESESGQIELTIANVNKTDWAVSQTGERGQLVYDKALSSVLDAGTTLTILGYPLGKGANHENDVKPFLSECKVARDGLDNGIIDIGGRSFTHGNSGGPVFTLLKGKYVVVGIVSAGQETIGYIVPISALQ